MNKTKHQQMSAQLVWDDDGHPYSTDFEDHYFSVGKGREETRFVFLESNDLPNRWKDQSTCVVGELGFGTGLGFLETWALWKHYREPDQTLIFQSVEGFPMDEKELARACSPWEDLASLSQILLSKWPGMKVGPVAMDEQTILHVVFDDVATALPQFEKSVDTWFLDGFAPARNPQMWSAEVMQLVADASNKNAQFSSYTAAGWVRQNLTQAGFSVDRRKGFGNKRHMITGRLERSA